MTEHTKQQIYQYLDDVNDSAPGQSSAYLKELIIEAFALNEDEANQVYKEWWAIT